MNIKKYLVSFQVKSQKSLNMIEFMKINEYVRKHCFKHNKRYYIALLDNILTIDNFVTLFVLNFVVVFNK